MKPIYFLESLYKQNFKAQTKILQVRQDFSKIFAFVVDVKKRCGGQVVEKQSKSTHPRKN